MSVPRMVRLQFASAALFLALLVVFSCTAVQGTEYRLAVFRAEVTVPMGHRLMGVLPVKSQRVADPLEARGFVLVGGAAPIVWVAVDWCEIRNEAFDRWREVLAAAAGTRPERVIVTSLHQHDAPVVDLGAQRLLDEVGLAKELCDTEFHEACLQRVAKELNGALPAARRVTQVGVGKGRVHEVASNRRMASSTGRVEYSRGSASGSDPQMRDAPEGLIDRWLKTLSFWDGDEPVLALHTYATHPMTHYGKGEVSADFVGLARRLREKDNPQVFQIYVSGCSGDVTAGKYNDGSPENRAILAERLRAAMKEAWSATQRWPLETVGFRTVEMALPFRGGEQFTVAALGRQLRDAQLDDRSRILAAMALASRQRVDAGRKIMVPCVDLGRALVVSLPGESFVGYQLLAQQLRPDVAVLCAGYGECWTGYIPTREAWADDFTDTWLWVDRGAEVAMEQALRELLGPAG